MLNPIPLLTVSYIIAGSILFLIDWLTSQTMDWWDRPNALAVGIVATLIVAWVIQIVDILQT